MGMTGFKTDHICSLREAKGTGYAKRKSYPNEHTCLDLQIEYAYTLSLETIILCWF